jgi:hypothetical protein
MSDDSNTERRTASKPSIEDGDHSAPMREVSGINNFFGKSGKR